MCGLFPLQQISVSILTVPRFTNQRVPCYYLLTLVLFHTGLFLIFTPVIQFPCESVWDDIPPL